MNAFANLVASHIYLCAKRFWSINSCINRSPRVSWVRVNWFCTVLSIKFVAVIVKLLIVFKAIAGYRYGFINDHGLELLKFQILYVVTTCKVSAYALEYAYFTHNRLLSLLLFRILSTHSVAKCFHFCLVFPANQESKEFPPWKKCAFG